MVTKSDCMQTDQELFKKFQEQVRRGDYLFSTINLCDDCIELFLFKPDKTGIESVSRFSEYTPQSYEDVKKMLDARARKMKDQWLEEFQKLAISEAEPFNWGIDLHSIDYAMLKCGSASTQQCYKLKWCFDDLWKAARYIAANSNPDLDD